MARLLNDNLKRHADLRAVAKPGYVSLKQNVGSKLARRRGERAATQLLIAERQAWPVETDKHRTIVAEPVLRSVAVIGAGERLNPALVLLLCCRNIPLPAMTEEE